MKRPAGMSEPSGIGSANDDPYPCDGCNRYIKPGQPFWGGGLDYFGEANNVYCERCEIAAFKYAEKQCAEYERELNASATADRPSSAVTPNPNGEA